jgi:hypothetical protein
MDYNEDVHALTTEYVLNILHKTHEGLKLISKYEKLVPNEGQLKVVYGQQVGFELYAPHLIPGQLSTVWLADSFVEAYTQAMKDINLWIEIEKDAPRDKFWLDLD